MMTRCVMWIAFMVTLQFSAVLCRNPFQEYFYNKYHHKGHSTTGSISSSTSAIFFSGISSEEITASSVSDGSSQEDLLHSSTEANWLQNVLHSFTVDNGTAIDGNKTILLYGDTHFEEQYFYNLRIGLICLSVVIVAIGACCVSCCIRVLRRRNIARTGFVISNTEARVLGPRPQPPVISQQHQQPLIAQPYPPRYTEERAQLFPAQYQTQPVQQQFPPQYQTQPEQQQFPPQYQTPYQYSPTEQQSHNPPEAPPPYEFPTKF